MVAKPGTLPDPRFSRDAYEEHRKAAYMKENKLYHIPQHVAQSLKSGSPSPIRRGATSALSNLTGQTFPSNCPPGPPYGLINNTDSTPSNPRSTTTCARTTGSSCANSLKATTSSASYLPVAPNKCMENLSSLPEAIYKPQKLSTTHTLTKLAPATKGDIPAWTVHLQKILTEDTAKSVVQPVKPSTPSIPPHLRKKGLPTLDKAGPRLDPESSIPLESIATNNRRRGNHGHWIKTRMVMIMEEDLDLEKRASNQELMAMTDNEINLYLLRISSAHEQWWEAQDGFGFENTNDSE
ncbi:hypothetical protein BKA66DRAFT_436101 [Pyrenochaeta sp. MPI-SDFR-AT-0127]|nr:hypothetical protein BKA66DRAFT_436101 [Pyrenochaeta sp. MPI-SDFR-AT-0127]